MKNKHGCYCLILEGIPFYIGYVQDRPIEDRLKEHIYSAQNPSKKEIENRAIRGGPTDKDKWILASIEDGLELTITKIHEAELFEQVQEDYWINEYKNQGHPITNIATGSTWQPLTLVDGELVETDNSESNANIRASIQDFLKRSKDRQYAEKVNKKVHKSDERTLTDEQKWELISRELSPETAEYMQKFKAKQLNDWQMGK